MLGTAISDLALPIVAVDLLGATSLGTGMLGAASTSAYLVIGLQAGVWIDRLPRRPFLLLSDAVRAALLLAIPILYAANLLTLPLLIVIQLGIGTAGTLFNLAWPAYLPRLATGDVLLRLNARLALLGEVSGLLGPGIAGALISIVKAPFAVLIDALSFVVSYVSLAAIRTPEPPRARRSGLTVSQELRDGVRADSGGVFTRAEEVGLVGAAALASRRGLPEDALVVSIEASRELPGATMGNGPVIRVGDAATTFHPAGDAFFRAARDVLRQSDPHARVQRQLMSGGVCEGTTYTAAGYVTGAVCVPLGNYHNQRPEGGLGAEFVHVDDLRGCAALLRATSGLIADGFDWPKDDPLSQRYLARPTAQLDRLRRSAPRLD